jgi:hypothetical protein
MPLSALSVNIDMAAIQRGYVQQFQDGNGRDIIIRTTYDEELKRFTTKKYSWNPNTTDEEKDDYIDNVKVGEGAWADTKKFWSEEEVEHTSKDPKRIRAFKLGWNISFTTFGVPRVVVGRAYKLMNVSILESMGANEPENLGLTWITSKVRHTFSDTYRMTVDMAV